MMGTPEENQRWRLPSGVVVAGSAPTVFRQYFDEAYLPPDDPRVSGLAAQFPDLQNTVSAAPTLASISGEDAQTLPTVHVVAAPDAPDSSAWLWIVAVVVAYSLFRVME